MIEKSPAPHVKPPARPEAAGRFFSVKAGAQRPDGLWLLESGGESFAVKARGELSPGGFYRGVFVQGKDGLEFVIKGKEAAPAMAHPALRETPLPGSPEYSRFTLLRAFTRAELPPPQGPILEEMLRFVRRGTRRETQSRASLVLMCEIKGLRLTEDGYEKIYALAEGFSGEGSGGGSGGSPNGEDSGGGKAPASGETRGENGKSPASAQDSAFPPSEPSSPDSSSETLLQLFNHIAPRSENWVIYPYRCSVDTETYAGSLKALYTSAGKAQNYVLSVRSRRRQDEVWRFTWKNRGKLKVYYTGNLSTANELFPKWARKFRKLGLFSDDTIYNGEFFDGFGDFPDEENSVNEMA